MEQTVFAMFIAFASWDDCWDFYHDNNIEAAERKIVICTEINDPAVAYERESAAPKTSLRPRMRPEGLGE